MEEFLESCRATSLLAELEDDEVSYGFSCAFMHGFATFRLSDKSQVEDRFFFCDVSDEEL